METIGNTYSAQGLVDDTVSVTLAEDGHYVVPPYIRTVHILEGSAISFCVCIVEEVATANRVVEIHNHTSGGCLITDSTDGTTATVIGIAYAGDTVSLIGTGTTWVVSVPSSLISVLLNNTKPQVVYFTTATASTSIITIEGVGEPVEYPAVGESVVAIAAGWSSALNAAGYTTTLVANVAQPTQTQTFALIIDSGTALVSVTDDLYQLPYDLYTTYAALGSGINSHNTRILNTETGLSDCYTITFSSNPADGETLNIWGVTYTFKDTPVGATDVQRHSSAAGTTMLNFVTTLSANASVANWLGFGYLKLYRANNILTLTGYYGLGIFIGGVPVATLVTDSNATTTSIYNAWYKIHEINGERVTNAITVALHNTAITDNMTVAFSSVVATNKVTILGDEYEFVESGGTGLTVDVGGNDAASCANLKTAVDAQNAAEITAGMLATRIVGTTLYLERLGKMLSGTSGTHLTVAFPNVTDSIWEKLHTHLDGA